VSAALSSDLAVKEALNVVRGLRQRQRQDSSTLFSEQSARKVQNLQTRVLAQRVTCCDYSRLIARVISLAFNEARAEGALALGDALHLNSSLRKFELHAYLRQHFA
jgi:hypothetical protein